VGLAGLHPDRSKKQTAHNRGVQQQGASKETRAAVEQTIENAGSAADRRCET